MAYTKQERRKRLEELANVAGENILHDAVFWQMFDMLTLNQRIVIVNAVEHHLQDQGCSVEIGAEAGREGSPYSY